MIHKIGFDIDVAEGQELSLSQLVDDLTIVLPEEWWGDIEEGEAWVLKCLYPLNDDGTLRQAHKPWRSRSYVQAELDQERKLTAHLEAELVTKHEQILAFQEVNTQQASVIVDQREQVTDLTSRLDDSLHEWTVKKNTLAVLIAQIATALGKAGFDIGWGDDDAMTLLEDSAASAQGNIQDVLSELDNLRTGR